MSCYFQNTHWHALSEIVRDAQSNAQIKCCEFIENERGEKRTDFCTLTVSATTFSSGMCASTLFFGVQYCDSVHSITHRIKLMIYAVLVMHDSVFLAHSEISVCFVV